MQKSPLIWLIKQMRRRIPALLAMTAAHVVHALLLVIFALGSRGVIDSAVSGDQDAFLQACLYQLAIIGGILISLALMRHLRDRLQADLEWDWKRRLLHGLLHGDYAAVSSYHSAELLNRLNNDVTKVNDGILSVIPSAAAMVTKLVAAIVVLGSLDGRFTLLIVAAGTVVIIVTGLMRHFLKALNKQVSKHDGIVSGFLQETMEKLLMVQTMDVAGEVENRADGLLKDRYEIQRKRKNVSLLANTCVSIMTYGAGFVTLVWGAWRLLHGQMSYGSLTAMIQLVNQLQSPFVDLSGVMPKYVAMIASAERLMELQQIQDEPEPVKQEPADMYRNMTAIEAEDLSFSYDRDQIFRNSAFSLPKGVFATITGPSGIGKSTLLKLLLGVFRPESGRLYLRREGEDVLLDRSTRRLFAYVPQGNLLLSGTIRENLTIVRPEATEEELAQAIYVSNMDAFLPQLPQGLDTPLGESGAGLSEGQAQRLAIARALLRKAPILLLDEATSGLDEGTEKQLLRNLRGWEALHTCVLVTHRPESAAFCSRGYEIQRGSVTEVTDE